MGTLEVGSLDSPGPWNWHSASGVFSGSGLSDSAINDLPLLRPLFPCWLRHSARGILGEILGRVEAPVCLAIRALDLCLYRVPGLGMWNRSQQGKRGRRSGKS